MSIHHPNHRGRTISNLTQTPKYPRNTWWYTFHTLFCRRGRTIFTHEYTQANKTIANYYSYIRTDKQANKITYTDNQLINLRLSTYLHAICGGTRFSTFSAVGGELILPLLFHVKHSICVHITQIHTAYTYTHTHI